MVRGIAWLLFVPLAIASCRSALWADEESAAQPPPLGERATWRQLNSDGTVWMNLKQKTVAVRGEVVLREGALEMFACPKGTKEHESIVAVHARAAETHAALLAVGLQSGTTVTFDPEYAAATGPKMEVKVAWLDNGQLQTARAQEWIRDVRSQLPMTYDWVFAGSGFWTDQETGERVYYAEGGELICVSNFSTAMLDLPVPSPEQNSELWFEPWTERIPPLGREVWLLLREAPNDR